MTTHLTLSQTTNTTEAQKNRISKIFTPDKIIEISKGLSNEILQDSVIHARDIQIKELKNKIRLLKEEHKKTLVSIALENSKAHTAAIKADSIADEQLTREKLKWSGIHLYSGIEVDKFKFESTSFNSELMYEFKNIHFGLKGELAPIVSDNAYNFRIALKIRYKIF